MIEYTFKIKYLVPIWLLWHRVSGNFLDCIWGYPALTPLPSCRNESAREIGAASAAPGDQTAVSGGGGLGEWGGGGFSPLPMFNTLLDKVDKVSDGKVKSFEHF